MNVYTDKYRCKFMYKDSFKEKMKVDKKTYSFRLYNPLMETVYSYCENENITPANYINEILSEKMAGKTVTRREYEEYIILELPLLEHDNPKLKMNLKDTSLIKDNNIHLIVQSMKKEKFIKVIILHPNNYLDSWVKNKGYCVPDETEQIHQGLNIVKLKLGDGVERNYYIKYTIYPDGTVKAFRTIMLDAIKSAKACKNKELLDKLKSYKNSDSYDLIDNFQIVKDKNGNVIDTLSNHEVDLEKENVELKKQLEDLKNRVDILEKGLK